MDVWHDKMHSARTCRTGYVNTEARITSLVHTKFSQPRGYVRTPVAYIVILLHCVSRDRLAGIPNRTRHWLQSSDARYLYGRRSRGPRYTRVPKVAYRSVQRIKSYEDTDERGKPLRCMDCQQT